MTNEWNEAVQQLSDDEIKQALQNQLEHMNETEAGITRQILGSEQKPLSQKQQSVYEKKIKPTLVEKCGNTGCGRFVIAGVFLCQVCEIEYGS
ncbi:hypothetical protein [Aliivibrio sifiae]|uniref:hypothetical protein n=1 Tax=Aliivibrio sifiae TaxID=566293 RepID=UPI003D0AFA2B